MTKYKTLGQIHAKLVKIAQDELAIANGDASTVGVDSQAGPQEVVDELTEVIDDLQAVVEAVPAEPSEEAAEEIAAEPAEALEPDESDSVLPARIRRAADDKDDDDEDKEKDAKIAGLTAKVNALNAHVAKEKLAKIAEEYASEVFQDTRQQQAKYDEIISAKKTPEYWTARLEAITEFKESNNVTSQQKPAKNQSFYKYAKKITTPGELNL